MVGIISYGGYIPVWRMNRMTIYSAMGFLNPASLLSGEKAVMNFDEDSITMAVGASMDCLSGLDRGKVDGLYFATTTAPYKERQNAGIIATALDLRPDVRTSDFTDSTKAGTGALLSACDAVKSGSAKSILVVASDCRLGKPGSYLEEMYGDGAAAILVGEDGVAAAFGGNYSVSYDFMDYWEAAEDRYSRQWEDRWIRDEGYTKFIPEAIGGLLNKYNLKPGDFAKVAYPCLFTRAHTSIGKGLGIKPEQLQDHLFTTVGYTGTSSPLMILVGALEEAKPGDKILVASYGSGSDALFFEAAEGIGKIKGNRKGISKNLAPKKDLGNYEKSLISHESLEIDTGGRGEQKPTLSSSSLWRHRRDVLGLVGSRCKRCGTPQYPPQTICVKPGCGACGALGEMEDYRFCDKKARLFTYTADSLAFSSNPPAIYGMVDFEEGGRNLFDLTDCTLDELKVDMPVELSFRRKFHNEARGAICYAWKAVPPRG